MKIRILCHTNGVGKVALASICAIFAGESAAFSAIADKGPDAGDLESGNVD